MSTLTLSILNLDALVHGVTASHTFAPPGGSIGSGAADWWLIDRDQGIAALHCEIRWMEGRFCILDHSQRTFLNEATCTLGLWPPCTLQEGDVLGIGGYRIRVRQQVEAHPPADVETLLNAGHTTLQALLPDLPRCATRPPRVQVALDICSAFDPEPSPDPVVALEREPRKRAAQLDTLHRLIAGERP